MLTLRIYSVPFPTPTAGEVVLEVKLEDEKARFAAGGWTVEICNREPNRHGDQWSYLFISRPIHGIDEVGNYWTVRLLGLPKHGVVVEFQDTLLPLGYRPGDGKSPFLNERVIQGTDSADLPVNAYVTPDISRKTLEVGVWGAEAEGEDACQKFWRFLWAVERKTRIARKLHQMRMMMEPKNRGAVERLHREVLELVGSFRR
jgi:hypothetical protein